MERLVHTIIDQQIPCYFISPHLDDAILSAGGLIQHLAGKTDVTIVTVFTAVTGRETLSARQFLKQCHYQDAQKLFSDRRAEDKRIATKLGVQAEHLGFADALWRERPVDSPLVKFLGRFFPELLKVYPTYRFHVARGRVSLHDSRLIHEIAIRLRQSISADGPYQVFCPQAIGNHIDHVVVRAACEQAFPSIIGWADFPYNARQQHMQPEAWRWLDHITKKRELIHYYRTQAAALFAGGDIPIIPEEYQPL